MKIIVSLTFLLIIFAGCAPSNFTPFHSRASIPQFSEFTETDLHFVTLDDDITNSYGIFCGTDDDSLFYVLVAPKWNESEWGESTWGKKSRQGPDPYYYYNFNRAATLSISNIEEFITILEKSVAQWSDTYDFKDATYLEFYITQEQDRKLLSEHVAEDNSSLRYWCQANSRGTTAFMWFGEGLTKIAIEFSEEGTLRLKLMLETALNLLKSNGAT